MANPRIPQVLMLAWDDVMDSTAGATNTAFCVGLGCTDNLQV